jgi:hypothetical protein
MGFLSTGESFAVSTSELESKIDAATGKFIKSLSKSQKALGMSIDMMGHYVNAQGKCVEGLSQAQIKLGQYVDEEGKVRTENGGFVADLTKIEQALGFYADKLGVVYNAQHEAVRITAESRKETALKRIEADKAAKALEEAAEKEARAVAEAERAKQAALEKTIQKENEEKEAKQRQLQITGQAAGAVSQLTGQFASLLASIECTDEEVGGFRSGLIQLTEAVSVGFGTFQSGYLGLNNFSQALPSIKAGLASTAAASAPASAGLAGVGASAKMASVGMKAFQIACGPVGIAVAAIGAGLAALATTSHVGKTKNSELSDSFKELEKRAKAAGDSIKSVGDALKYGAFSARTSEIDAAIENVAKANEALKRAKGESAESRRKSAVDAAKYVGYMGGSVYQSAEDDIARETAKAKAAQKKAWAEYNDAVAKMVDAARQSQKTELDRLNEQLKVFKNIREYAKGTDAQNVVQKQIATLEQKIREENAKETEETEKAAQAEREKAREALGVLEYVQKENELRRSSAKTLEELRELNERWKKAESDGVISSEELAAAQKQAAEEFLEKKYGIDLNVPEVDADSIEGINAGLKEIEDALDSHLITQDQHDTALKELTKKKLEAIPGLQELIDANETAKKAEEDYAKALKIAEEYSEESPFDKGDVFSQEQLDILKNGEDETLRSAMIEYASAMEAAAEGLKNQVVSQETYDELVKRANENLAKAADEAAKKLKEDVRSELGIDSIMESLKSSVQKYNETMEKARKALEKDQISQEEFNALQEKLNDDLLKQSEVKDDLKKEADKVKIPASEGKTEPSKSMKSGSEELYLAQVKNSTSNYQSRIQSTTENLYKTSQESLWQSQQTNYYLQEMLEGSGSLAVFG